MIIFLFNAYLVVLALLIWLKIIPFNLFWKLSPLIWLAILVVGLFIPMGWGAPSGPAMVIRQSVQIVPNVAGEVIDVPVAANTPLKDGDVLFRIDPTPFEYKAKELKAQLVEAEHRAKQLQANVDAAAADVKAITGQLAYAQRRRDDIGKLARTQAASEFRLEDEQKQVDTLTAQQSAAKAHETSASIALSSQIDGVNTDVARLTAQLGHAEWELEQTTVRAPSAGYVTNVALRKGARVTPLPLAPVMAFIDTSQTVVGIEIAQINSRYIEPGQNVELTFKVFPGVIQTGRVETVLQALASGQARPSGVAVSPVEIQSAPLVVRVKLDDEELASRLPAGGTGDAAIFTEHVRVTHIIRRVMLRMIAFVNYINPF